MVEERRRRMHKRIIKKIILAVRPRYDWESEEEYNNIPFSKRIKAYIVLDAFKDYYLVSRLKYLESQKEKNYALFKSDYPNITYASLPDGSVYLLPKKNLFRVISEKLNGEHFDQVVTFLSGRGMSENDTKIVFSKFAKKYFKWRVRVGDIVTIINENGSYSTYYVKEKLESDFIAILLHYDVLNGISATDEEFCIPYDSRYDFIANNSEYRQRVESLINERKLKLTMDN